MVAFGNQREQRFSEQVVLLIAEEQAERLVHHADAVAVLNGNSFKRGLG